VKRKLSPEGNVRGVFQDQADRFIVICDRKAPDQDRTGVAFKFSHKDRLSVWIAKMYSFKLFFSCRPEKVSRD
jgi:hypothetical protein